MSRVSFVNEFFCRVSGPLDSFAYVLTIENIIVKMWDFIKKESLDAGGSLNFFLFGGKEQRERGERGIQVFM